MEQDILEEEEESFDEDDLDETKGEDYSLPFIPQYEQTFVETILQRIFGINHRGKWKK